MPDLANRANYEKELAAILAMLWAKAVQTPTPEAVFRTRWASASSLAGPLESVYARAAGQLAKEFGVEVPAEKIKTAAKRWAVGYSSILADELHKTTARTAGVALSASANGTGDFASVMRAAFTSARAEVIAATEVTRAATAGERGLFAYATMTGMIGEKQAIWHTELDGRVCELCNDLHGAGQEVYGLVSISGPPAHPNCRCWLDWE